MLKTLLISALSMFFAFSGRAAASPDGMYIASGSQVVAAVNAIKPAFEKDSSGTKIYHVKEDGMAADSVLLAVSAGKAEVGLLGATREDLQKLIAEKNIEIKNFDQIVLQVVGQDRLSFVTYKGGPKELTREQLKGLFTGKITNWKDVGGEDTPVQIVLPLNSPATQKLISTKILDGEDFFRKGVKLLNVAKELPEYVGATKGALSFGPSSMSLANVNHPKHPEVSRPIGAITLGKPSPRAAKLIEMIEKHLAGK